MDSKVVDFKEYYHKKLDEEMAAQQQSTAEQSYETQAMNNSVESLLQVYVREKDLKEGLKKLGADLGAELVRFATEQYVNRDQFASEDDYLKYVNVIKQKIEQNATKTLIELLKHISIDIQNSAVSLTA